MKINHIQKNLHIINLETCDSTNDYVKKNLTELEGHFPVLVTSAEQVKGRGRGQRKWISILNKGIYSSFGICLDQEKPLSLMPIISGISVIETLEKISNTDFYIKWPNDILHREKKIAGILIENIIHKPKTISISGIGININNIEDDFPEQIKKRATSLKVITGEFYHVDQVIETLADRFLHWLNQLRREKYSSIIKKANQMSRFLIGKKINLHQNDKKIEGIFVKINEDGGIIIKNKDGKKNTFFYGEISNT
jgi:BirA family biotin operon repressor/biotin-[acetyl-CoA-carboxylase] ligase